MEVFGSLARCESHPGSDIDLLVTFQPGVHLGWDFFDLHKEIEGILGCEVDLLTRRSVEHDENAIASRSCSPPVKSIPPKQAAYLLDSFTRSSSSRVMSPGRRTSSS